MTPYDEYDTRPPVITNYLVFAGVPEMCRLVIMTQDKHSAEITHATLTQSFIIVSEGGNWRPYIPKGETDAT